MTGKWHQASAPLRQEFSELLDLKRIRELHQLSGWRHGLVAS
ncbi:MAG: hypothetical protein ACYS0F_11645 [Planctomycetota bacterium]|jgi:hypothetical protein